MSDQTMVPLADAPVGLFRHDETFAIKTEYVSDNGWIHAYIVSSGEAFWGPSPQTVEGQRNLIVEPIDLEGMLAAAKAREEAATKWISQSVHEEGCRSFYDDQTGICVNEEPDINDPRCDCGLQEQFDALPADLRVLVLAASEPPGEPSETGGSPVTPGA